ncbi:MAG: SDR family oxidoreductase [Pseudomonadota bacterium]
MSGLFSLEGHRVLLSGAAGGIGTALAEALSGLGARLALADLDGAAARALGRDLEADWAGPLDITDEDACDGVCHGAAAAMGGLDALVNAAGLLTVAKADRLGGEAFRAGLEVNLTGAYLFSVAARRQMAHGGRIVHLASVSSLVATPGYAGYAAAKAGLAQLVRVLALEWARDGIAVNALAPAMLETQMTAELLVDQRFRERVLAEIPMRRLATPEDLIAPLALLLAEGGRFITGQILPVDGGRTLV